MEQSRIDGLYKIRVDKIYIRAYLEKEIPQNTELDIEELEQAKLLENMIQNEPQAIKFEKENACRQKLNKTQADSYLEQAEMKTEKGESKEQHMGASYKRFHFEKSEKQRVTEYHLTEERLDKGQNEQDSTQDDRNCFFLKPSTTSKDRKHFATRQKRTEIVSDQIAEIKRSNTEKQKEDSTQNDDGNCFFLKPSTTSKDRKHFATRQKRTEIVSDQIAEIKRSDAEKQKEQDSTQDDGNCFFLKPSTTSKDRKHFATRKKRTEIVSDQIAEIKRSDAEKQKEQDSTQDDGNCFFLKPSTTSKDRKHFATRQKRTEIVSDQIAEIKRSDAEKQKEQDSTQDDGNCFFLKPSTTSKDRKHFATRQKRTEIVSDQIAEIKRSDAEKQKEQDSTQDDGNCFFLKPSTTSKDRKHFATRQKRTEIVSDQIAEIKRRDAEKQKEQDSTQDDENCFFLKPSTTSKDRKHFATRQKRTEIVSDQIAEIKRSDAEKQKEQDSTQDDGNCFFLKPSTTSKDRKHFATRQKRTEIVSDQIAEIKRSDAEKQKEQDSTQDDENSLFLKPSTTSKDRKHFATRKKRTEIVSDQIAEIKRRDAEKQKEQDSTQNDDGNCFFLKPSTTSKDRKHFATRQKRTEIVSDQIAEIKRRNAEREEKSLEFVKSKGTERQQEKQRASNYCINEYSEQNKIEIITKRETEENQAMAGERQVCNAHFIMEKIKEDYKYLGMTFCPDKENRHVLQSQFLKSGLKDQTLDSEDLAEETWNSNVDSHDFTKLFISVTEAQVGHPSSPTRLPTNVQTTNSPCSSVSEISAQGRVPKPPSGKPTYVNSRKSSHRIILETDAKVTAPKPQKLKPIIIHSKNSSYPFTSDKDAQMGPPKLPSIKRRNDEGRNSYLRYNSPRDTQERSTELPAITIKEDQNVLSHPVKPRYLVLPPIINKVNIIFPASSAKN
ncbi:calponin homology domain-containing protein DDB_G0272472-like [Fundulus heteroclitus]|uniref:calponin homology domain-containing protein DDB_G0272472-like n=1 Tax=Fundulus heteroclitus TaxID=8078 RepID=UPI00165BF8D2|nr:calponin homology domain-containing protein DDB_G0272472-like [Fundulus heteroclitus]